MAPKDNNKGAAKLPDKPKPTSSKKRKADQVSGVEEALVADKAYPIEESKENMDLPSTPTTAETKKSKREESNEKTPGRVGPIRIISYSLKPDIKPFKGPPGKKVRKSPWEKEEEYKQFIRDNESHCFHDLYVCFDKGPKGSPTYDSAGFQLDYDKVADWMKPKAYNKSAMVNGMEKRIDQRARDEKRMAEIFFEEGEAPEEDAYSTGADYWKDRVSKDLNIPWHKIKVEHFEDWAKKGFKRARKGEYETFSLSEKKRMSGMMSGADLRK